MALLSFSPAASKGSSSTVTLNKVELLALPEVSGNIFWSSSGGSNISHVIILYKSTEGEQNKLLKFDFSQSSPTSSVSFSLKARNTFQIYSIILTDFDEGELVLNRPDFLITTPSLSSLDIDFGTSPANYEAEVLADSPYIYYRFQETSGTAIADSSGSGRNATLTPGSGGLLNQTGAVAGGASIYFDGSGTKVITDTTHLSDSPVSIEFWMKASVSQTSTLVSHSQPSSWSPEIKLNSVAPGGVISSYVFNNSATTLYDSTGGHADGQWHHIVITVGPTNNHSVYIDGVLSVTGGNSGAYAGAMPWNIGFSQEFGQYFQGYISEVAIYTTELSAARISAHYAASGISSSTVTSLWKAVTTNPVWRLDATYASNTAAWSVVSGVMTLTLDLDATGGSGGSAGSGTYYIDLPGGYTLSPSITSGTVLGTGTGANQIGSTFPVNAEVFNDSGTGRIGIRILAFDGNFWSPGFGGYFYGDRQMLNVTITAAVV